MRKAIISGLIVFALVASWGVAMAGPSEIGIRTYTERGEFEGLFTVNPQYLSAHEFAYCSSIDTGKFAEDVSTFTWTSVPAVPGEEEDMPDTIFFQSIDMDEVGRGCCGGYGEVTDEYMGGGGAEFWDSLWIADIASDDGQDDAYHYLELGVKNTGDNAICDPPGATASKDLSVTTTWVSNGADYLAMTQDIFVENKMLCGLDGCGCGGCGGYGFDADAIGWLESCNTYGNDYTFLTDMWGSGLEYQFQWLIGGIEMPEE